jgi:MerR HTH family regulatory protein
MTKADETQARWKAWYKKNREIWNQHRRERYASDPRYREAVLKSSDTHREAQREVRSAERLAESEATVFLPQDNWRTVQGSKDPKDVLYTIGYAAKALDVSIQAIRLWDSQGIFPKTDRGTGNSRLYSLNQIEMMRKAIANRQGYYPKRTKDKKNTLERWTICLDDGSKLERILVPLSALASSAQRRPASLLQLERKGYLPRTTLRGPLGRKGAGRRLYTVEQAELVTQLIRTCLGSRDPKVWADFRSKVETGWRELRCWNARLVSKITTVKEGGSDGNP